ncbi:MAG: hypothetical protein WAS21_21070 [Geminicoccaceae bacterium]
MVSAGGDDRVNVQITWPKLLTLAAAIIVAIGGGYWALIQATLNSFDQRIAETGQDLQAGVEEDRGLRTLIGNSNDALRFEIVALRQEFGQRIDQLGDRLVEANAQIGNQIGLLRAELVSSMDRRDTALGGRFDRLEQKMDNLLTRISFEPAIQAPAGTYMIDAEGNFYGEKGDLLGTLPAVLKSAPAKP